LAQVAHIQSNLITTETVTFTCATVIDGVIYIGTNEQGVLTMSIANPTAFEFLMPDGPVRNMIFRVKNQVLRFGLCTEDMICIITLMACMNIQ